MELPYTSCVCLYSCLFVDLLYITLVAALFALTLKYGYICVLLYRVSRCVYICIMYIMLRWFYYIHVCIMYVRIYVASKYTVAHVESVIDVITIYVLTHCIRHTSCILCFYDRNRIRRQACFYNVAIFIPCQDVYFF